MQHHPHYNDMQKRADLVVNQINGYISRINKNVGASTPFLHDTIMENRGRKGKRYYVYRWDKFSDGLHAKRPLQERWAEVLKNAFRLNERNDVSDDEDRSPKRSWRDDKRLRTH